MIKLTKKRNLSIDFLRVIAAFLILILHCGACLPIMGTIAATISQYGVPIFAVITGYFYFHNPTSKHLTKIINNILRLWFFWILVYFPKAIYSGNLNVFLNNPSDLKTIISSFFYMVIYRGAQCFLRWCMVFVFFCNLFTNYRFLPTP